MFAQLQPSPDPQIAWNVITTIGVLVCILANIVAILGNRRAQKRQISFEFEPAGKEAFDQHVENFVQHVIENRVEHERIRAELKADRHDNQVHASTRAAGIYKKVDEVRQELERKIESLAADVNQTPDRTVALLRNTGVIK